MSPAKQKNQAAYLKTKEELAARFPQGHFIAFDDGEIVADAETFDELTEALIAVGKNRRDIFVIQAGVETPKQLTILL